MQAQIEEMPIVALGNDGVMIRIRNENGSNVGKLWFGQANLKWGRGSVSKNHAKRVPVQELIAWLNEHPGV